MAKASTLTAETVKEFIQSKFGTVPRFASLVGLEAAAIWGLFKRVHPSPELTALYKLAKATKNAATCFELNDGDRKRLAEFLAKQYNGNASAFARAKSGVDQMTVSHILTGFRRRKTAQVRAVFAAAGLDLSQPCTTAEQPGEAPAAAAAE